MSTETGFQLKYIPKFHSRLSAKQSTPLTIVAIENKLETAKKRRFSGRTFLPPRSKPSSPIRLDSMNIYESLKE